MDCHFYFQGRLSLHCGCSTDSKTPPIFFTHLFINCGCISYSEPTLWPSAAAAAAKSLQSCPTLRHPIDGSPPGSSIPGILQARTLEWGAIAFSVGHLVVGKKKGLCVRTPGNVDIF